jgi:NADP-dependent 3-hydroxy acid dehydrogenase YdfG
VGKTCTLKGELAPMNQLPISSVYFFIIAPSLSGIGVGTALSLASANPGRISLAGRSEAKIKPVMDPIKEMNHKIDIMIVLLDPSDNTSVQQVAKTINSYTDFFDVSFNNACGPILYAALNSSVRGTNSCHFRRIT